MVVSIVKEYLDFYAQNWLYLADKLANMVDHPEFASIINGGMVGLEKQVGFPKEVPSVPVPVTKTEEKTKDAPKPTTPTPKEQTTPNKSSETVPGEFPYDKDHMHWTFCPVCHNRDIDQVSDKTGKHYQACGPCKVYLNSDGKVVRIGSGERVKAVGNPGEKWRWVKVSE
jgi:hypothetical protein